MLEFAEELTNFCNEVVEVVNIDTDLNEVIVKLA